MSTGSNAKPRSEPVPLNELDIIEEMLDGWNRATHATAEESVAVEPDVESTPDLKSTRCPYPDCAAGKSGTDSARELVNGLFVCTTCGRLSGVCPRTDCEERYQNLTLNRPFVRFCRRCRNLQESPSKVVRSAWDRIHDEVGETSRGQEIQSPIVLHSISDFEFNSLSGNVSPDRDWQLLWADGVLALHSQGYRLRLIHPFADLAPKVQDASRVAWIGPFAEGADQRNVRLFPLVMTRDRRFVLYSNSLGVQAADLWSLPGWGTASNCRLVPLKEGEAAHQEVVVAAPVALTPPVSGPLTAENANCLVGVLSQRTHPAADPAQPTTARTLVWRVYDLNTGAKTARLVARCEFKLAGKSVQVVLSEDRILAFASELEFKWWSWEDALTANGEKIREGLGGNRKRRVVDGQQPVEKDDVRDEFGLRKDAEFLMKSQFTSGTGFAHQTMHMIHFSDSFEDGQDVIDEQVEFCFATTLGVGQDNERKVGVCELNPVTGTVSLPKSLDCIATALEPIGVMNNALYLLGRVGTGGGATIFRRNLASYGLVEYFPEVTGRFHEIEGKRVTNGNAILVMKGGGQPYVDRGAKKIHATWDIQVIRLGKNRQPTPVLITGLRLAADPVVVGPYLFTVERRDQSVCLIRRHIR